MLEREGKDFYFIGGRMVGRWIRYYNTQMPHQVLGYKSPIDVYKNECMLSKMWETIHYRTSDGVYQKGWEALLDTA
ncbi:MAG: hypothetical protein DRG50_09650 [Deltaproteobacteria bacterium]|nr:MAG: hypothetical protein DRG50_09650 [Deltaproteobacteria bacterium]